MKSDRQIHDRKGILSAASPDRPIELELGCGRLRKYPQALGVDLLDAPEVDVVGDVFEVLRMLPESSVTAAYSDHFFEHIEDTRGLLEELARVTVDGGLLVVVVPHFSNPFFYSDPTHRVAFGLYSFSYLSEDTVHRRAVPQYFGENHFELLGADLVFKSNRPNYIRHSMAKAVGLWVNRSTRSREKYEERYCYLFPCYEIEYRLARKGRGSPAGRPAHDGRP